MRERIFRPREIVENGFANTRWAGTEDGARSAFDLPGRILPTLNMVPKAGALLFDFNGLELWNRCFNSFPVLMD